MKRLKAVGISCVVLMLATAPWGGRTLAQTAGADPEKDRMQAEIARLQKAFDYFQSERDQLKVELEKEQAQNKLLKDRLVRFTQALQKNKQAIEIYKNRLKNVADTPNELQSKLDQTNLKIVQLETDRNKLADQLRQLKMDLTKEQRLRETQEQMTQEKELAAHDAEVRAEAAQRQIRLMTAEQEKLQAHIETLKKQAETDYSGYLNLEERIADYETRMNVASQQIQTGLEEIARLREALNKADAEYAELKKQMQQRESDLAERLRRADANARSLDVLAQEKQQAEQELSTLKKAFRDEQQARRTMEQQARDLEQKLLTDSTGLDEARRDVVRLTRENEQLTQDLRVFEKALEEERARRQVQEDLARRVRLDSGNVQRDIESLQLKLQMAEQERAVAEKKESEAKDAMDALLRSQQMVQDNLNQLQAEHQELLADYQAVQQDTAEAERRMNESLKNVNLLKKALAKERQVRTEKEKLVEQLKTLQSSEDSKMGQLSGQLDQLKAQLVEARQENRMLKESLTVAEQTAVEQARQAPSEAPDEKEELIRELKKQLEAREREQSGEREKGYEAAQLELGDEIYQLKDALKRAEQRAGELEKELQSRPAEAAIAASSRQVESGLEAELQKAREQVSNYERRNEQLRAETDRMTARLKDMEQRMEQQERALKQARLEQKQQSAVVDAAKDGMSKPVFGETASEVSDVKKFTKLPQAEPKPVAERPDETAPVSVPPKDDYADLEAVLAEVEPEPDPERVRIEKEQRQEAALMSRAFTLYSNGDVVNAKEQLNKLLALNADHVDALGMAGVIAWQEGDMDQAVRYLEKALSLDERNARAHNYMGIVQNTLGQVARAQNEFKRAMELDTSYDEPVFNLAVILATADEPRVDEARRYYERALALGSERNSNLEEIIYP